MMMGNKNLRNVGVIPIIKDVCICIYIKFQELMASGFEKVPGSLGKTSYFGTKQFVTSSKKTLRIYLKIMFVLTSLLSN